MKLYYHSIRSVLAFVLALVLLASSAFEWLKRLTVVFLFVGMAMEMGVPWLVRYGAAWTVHLLLLTAALIIVGVFVSVAIPLYEMWWQSGAGDATGALPQEWRRAG